MKAMPARYQSGNLRLDGHLAHRVRGDHRYDELLVLDRLVERVECGVGDAMASELVAGVQRATPVLQILFDPDITGGFDFPPLLTGIDPDTVESQPELARINQLLPHGAVAGERDPEPGKKRVNI